MIELLIGIGGRWFALAALGWVVYAGICIAVSKLLPPAAVVACVDCDDEDRECVPECEDWDEGAAWDRGRDEWIDREMGVAS